jgi:hypothetical protein
MTTNEIRNRIAELDNELIYIEFADRMSDTERKRHDELLRERNALATELYNLEHPKKTVQEIEEENEREYQEWKAEREEMERRKEAGREEAEKSLALKLWNALKDTNWAGLPTLEKKMKANGWI